MDAVTIDSATKSFGDVRAVDDLNVQIPRGGIYGVLGPNGAGKTTALRMIMNIIRPDSGHISVLGNSRIDKSQVGYMPEERGLYRKMKVREILSYFAAIKSVEKSRLKERVNEWLKVIELADWADKKVEELSRGMHQKLQFAITVINEPQLLILDEPFSGLDPVNQELLKRLLNQMRDQGRTIVLSTHLMHEAERLCENILMINRGRAVLQGNLKQIKMRYTPNCVSLEVGGEIEFIRELKMVESVANCNGRLEVKLSTGADSQDLLAALIGRVRVKVFETKLASLHEIFLEVAGPSDE